VFCNSTVCAIVPLFIEFHHPRKDFII